MNYLIKSLIFLVISIFIFIVRSNLILFTTGIIGLVSLFGFQVIKSKNNKAYMELLIQYLKYGTEMKKDYYVLESGLEIGKDVLNKVKKIKAKGKDRKTIDDLLKNTLRERGEDYILGVWTMWEPNAFDNKDDMYRNKVNHDETGRFFSYCRNLEEEINLIDTKEIDGGIDAGVNEKFYTRPMQEKKITVIEPYICPFNNDLMTTISLPIISRKKAIGVVGVDIRIATKNISEDVLLYKVSSNISNRNRLEELLNEKSGVYEVLTKAVQSIISNKEDVLSVISSSTEEVSSFSKELLLLAEQGNTSIETAIGLIENMSAGIQQISASSQEVASFSQEANSKTNKGSQNVEHTLDSIKKINRTIDETVGVINKLGENSEQIGQIVELITGIAEQTNLLALNAAIEAARAGEAGQGFAVVAEEIRQLASETTNASDEISNLITQTQKQSRKAIEKVKEVVRKAKDGQEIAKQTGSVFEEIKDSVRETSIQIEQTANTTNDLAQNSDEIVNSTDDIKKMSNELTTSSEKLSDMAQELQSLVKQFKYKKV
ncbi:methyl-accepting chemotaxis protein [Halonatronum saccharophilum]|uniref:methyl-accepting chemotaxis protein n=1 Tax=Halonatronum saccharophilum TaxID=150060 RepID=UPI0004B0CA81|nr:methyl-accepting chemotaxis protein [Halonatronum saccharophilum]